MSDLCKNKAHAVNTSVNELTTMAIPSQQRSRNPIKATEGVKAIVPCVLDTDKATVTATGTVSHYRKRKYKTDEEKLEANRKSAAESRQRKKLLMMKLQNEVTTLKQQNSLLRIENAGLKKKFILYGKSLHGADAGVPIHFSNVSNFGNISRSDFSNPSLFTNTFASKPTQMTLNAIPIPQIALQVATPIALTSNATNAMRYNQQSAEKN